jgi:predicted TIM-barrel fold metal-dependent hydrolase
MSLSPAVDVHAHFLPRSYRQALDEAGITQPDGFPHVPDWSADSAVEIMDELGIAVALLSISSPGVHFLSGPARVALARGVNQEGADAVRKQPSRFGLLATLPLPDVDGALSEIAFACDDLSVDGFVLMTNYDGIYLGDERFDAVMAELNRRGAVVALHPTSPPGSELTALGLPRPMIEFPFDTTRTVFNLILRGTLRRYPAIRVIAPHVGSAMPVLADRVDGFVRAFATGDSEPVDVFGELANLYFDITGAPFPNALAGLQRISAAGRLLYGSDTPFTPPPVIKRSAQALLETELLDDAERHALLRDNPIGLFPRLGLEPG